MKKSMGKLKFKETKTEIEAETFTEWDDHRIAELVREMAVKLKGREITGWEGVASMAATIVLISFVREANCGEFYQTLSNCTVDGTDICDDWEIIIRQTK